MAKPKLVSKAGKWKVLQHQTIAGKSKVAHLAILGDLEKMTEKEAQEEFRRYIINNPEISAHKITVKELLNEYFEVELKGRSKRAQEYHEWAAKHINGVMGHLLVRNVKHAILLRLKSELEMVRKDERARGGRTVRMIMGHLKRALGYASQMEYIFTVPPFPTVKVLKKPTHRLYPSEVESLLKFCDHPVFERQSLFIRILLGTGMRPAELDILDWSHVDLPRKIITVPQTRTTKRGGPVPIPDDLMGLLLQIAHKKGRFSPYPPGAYVKAMQRLSKRVGIKFSAKTFRPTFASIMFSRGVSVSIVAAILRNDERVVREWYLDFEVEHLRGSMANNPLAGLDSSGSIFGSTNSLPTVTEAYNRA